MPKFATRQINLPGFELGDYIQESIDFLRQNEPQEGYFVGFSGGKDSIVTLELCRIAGVRHRAFYSCTRIDPPEVMRFIKKEYPYVTWLYPEKSFYEYIQKKSPPLRHMRWCCDYLKKRPSSKIPLNHRIMGIRAEESFNRRNRPRIDKYLGKKILYKPIFMWPEWCVWDFIESQKLPYPVLYTIWGFHELGVLFVPLCLGQERQRGLGKKNHKPCGLVYGEHLNMLFAAGLNIQELTIKLLINLLTIIGRHIYMEKKSRHERTSHSFQY